MAATLELLEELTVARGGRLLEIVEDAGYGFVGLTAGISHDELMTALFSIPLGSWGEYEILLLGSMEAEHRAVMSAGMVPKGALPSHPQPRPRGLEVAAPASGRLRQISPEELWGLVEGRERMELIDVRTRAEVTSEGTLPAASNVPLDELPALLEEWVTSPPSDLVFVCAEGQRSLVAARAARRLGIDCASLQGGLRAWRDRGLPLDPVGAVH